MPKHKDGCVYPLEGLLNDRPYGLVKEKLGVVCSLVNPLEFKLLNLLPKQSASPQGNPVALHPVVGVPPLPSYRLPYPRYYLYPHLLLHY